MDLLPSKRSKRKQNNVTYADDIVAQPHASYERRAIVTKSGAIKHIRVEQNLAPPVPEVANRRVDSEASEPPAPPSAMDDMADDVLAGVEIPRNYKPRKVRCRLMDSTCRFLTLSKDAGRLYTAVF